MESKEASGDVDPEVEKKEVNDVTMVSEGKIQDDSFVSNATSLLSEALPKLPIRYEQTGMFGGQSSYNHKKRHLVELFYNAQGELI